MSDRDKLVAACWAMWSAIELAYLRDTEGHYTSLRKVAREVMTMSGQFKQEEQKNDR